MFIVARVQPGTSEGITDLLLPHPSSGYIYLCTVVRIVYFIIEEINIIEEYSLWSRSPQCICINYVVVVTFVADRIMRAEIHIDDISPRIYFTRVHN